MAAYTTVQWFFQQCAVERPRNCFSSNFQQSMRLEVTFWHQRTGVAGRSRSRCSGQGRSRLRRAFSYTVWRSLLPSTTATEADVEWAAILEPQTPNPLPVDWERTATRPERGGNLTQPNLHLTVLFLVRLPPCLFFWRNANVCRLLTGY